MIMQRKSKPLCAVIMLALVGFTMFCGCVATNLPPADRRVTIAEDLGTAVFVTDVRCAKGTSAFYTFQANVVNNLAHELWVEYKVVWVDADGMAIEPNAVWRQTALMPKEVKALQATAPRPDAVDMLFYVRRMVQ